MSGQSGDRLSWPDLLYIADFLWSNGQRQLSLLGGEPTLHPQCVDFVRYLLDRGFGVTLFSNGLLSRKRLDEFESYLDAVPTDRFNIVCNLNNPLQTPANDTDDRQLDAFLSLMGPFVTPGFNIYRHDFDLDFVFDLTMRYGLRRDLRIGVAHPVLGAANAHIRAEDMVAIVERLMSYRTSFERYRIRLSLDCGFPLCAFTDDQLGWLRRWANPTNFSCSPAIDVAPDMSVYHCFPLSQYGRKSLFDFDTLADIDSYFARIKAEVRSESAGVYPACDGCPQRDNAACGGGAMCAVLGRFIDEAGIRLTGIENELAKFRLPA